MAVTVRAVTPAVGAEISGADLRGLSDSDFAAIERAWTNHSMILLRGQKLSDDDLLAFSRRFGALDPPPNQERGRISPPGYPDIYVVSNVLDGKGDPIGALGAGEAVWHTDMSYLDTPPDASMLYSLEIPPSGGNTWFCGMQAACDALPADLLAKIKGRRIKHDGTYNSGGYLRKGVTPTDDPMAAPGAWHPAILRHPANGRATVEFLSLESPYGFHKAEIRIQPDDSLREDDRFAFAVERADPHPVLFLHQGGHPLGELYYRAALESVPEAGFVIEPLPVSATQFSAPPCADVARKTTISML